MPRPTKRTDDLQGLDGMVWDATVGMWYSPDFYELLFALRTETPTNVGRKLATLPTTGKTGKEA